MNDGIAFGARTTRNNNYVGIIKQTDVPNVGPGSYEALSSIQVAMPPPDAITNAAFGSSSQRKFKVAGDTGVTVGPGSYDVLADGTLKRSQSSPGPSLTPSMKEEINARTEALRIARGGSLYERKQSQIETKRTTPGPGQYNINDNWGDGHGAVCMQAAFGVEAAMNKSRQIGVPSSAVSWKRLPTAPTIPSRSQGHGYEEGMNGELIMVQDANKHYTGHRGDNPGPGEYTPKAVNARSSHAVNFGRGSLRPELVRIKPEPKTRKPHFGDSTHVVDQEDRFLPSPPKQSSMFRSSARSTPKPKTNTPGPGAYEAPSALNVKPKAPEELQFFGSTVQRFNQSRHVVPLAGLPGPGSYSISSTFDKPKRAVKQVMPFDRVGFQSTANRSNFAQCDNQVGPGQYQINGISDDLLKKQKRENAMRRSDSKGLSRGNTSLTTSQAETPGPATYFSNYDNSPPQSRGTSQKTLVKKGDGGSGMLKGSVLRSEENPQQFQSTSSFLGMGRTDMPATHRARLAAGGSQLGHGVDYADRNDVTGTQRKGPLTATESARVYTSNTALAVSEPDKFQLAEGTIPVSVKGPSIARTTGRKPLTSQKALSSTNELVGPGSYEATGGLDGHGKMKRSTRGVMDSKASRGQIFKNTSDSPGPGQYNLLKMKDSFIVPTYNAAIAQAIPS